MGELFIGQTAGKPTRISVEDEVLDRIANLLEERAQSGTGFWIAGQLLVERNGEPVHPDPANGHQRMWIPAGTILSFIYDRPLHPSPDVIAEDPNVIYL